ncbi:type II toxin-antitoxin system VapB family antitoxin [Caulobacter vibrioides]|uniref:PSK-family transcription factor n=1 Tax=Caulobacter vibrioides (strain NA1000 / CB15N) TaxID=565050 RepID=A0A0H3C609_CAUVN|nr:type II toxin-antitoxin system VapB family antitoxin [Caulobacter vibrioides]YP_002516049.1 PSK-family transcription factor [Caulobacter vibrioides NA1000]ACL94141.1 PSK-family transcription factor [Caulobacter vibrioides NA1000]ATC27484.1 transcription factor [Caulobacter vibrioides]QXZ52719.1 type II toxin-antitoxin system VapB family antitoxin [Caulobacter vibrioides]
MAFHVRDPETDALVRELAEKTKLGITEAVKLAAVEALQARDKAREEKLAKMRAICAEVASWPRTDLKADKAFFDDMYED